MHARLAIVLALLTAPAAGAQPAQPQKVLLIGNSLSMANGLAGMIEELARAAGGPRIETAVVARGGYSLEDHWNQGEARRVLATGHWSTVVLQQGPSSQPDSQGLLRKYVARFDREAKKSRTQTAIFMVWPPRAGPGTFDQVSDSYSRAARAVKGLLLPVGDVFRAALTTDPGAALFGPDGFHPTPLGSYLAAVVIYQRLAGRAVPFVPRTLDSPTGAFQSISLTPEMAALLESAAASDR